MDDAAYPSAKNLPPHTIGATTRASVAACEEEIDDPIADEEATFLDDRKIYATERRLIWEGMRIASVVAGLAGLASLLLFLAWSVRHGLQQWQQKQETMQGQGVCWTLRGPCSADECRQHWGQMQPGLITLAATLMEGGGPFKSKDWYDLHAQLILEAKGVELLPEGQPRLVLLGDSITYGWRTAGKNALDAVLAKHRQPLLLGISGDKCRHLLWRLVNGELPETLAADSGALFSVLIGANDAYNDKEDPHDTVAGVLSVLHFLLHRVRGKVLVNALLPENSPTRGPLPILECINALLREGVEEISKAYPGRARFIDCRAPFVHNASHVKSQLFSDKLHLNEAGYSAMAACLELEVKRDF